MNHKDLAAVMLPWQLDCLTTLFAGAADLGREWCFQALRNEGMRVASNRARHEAVMPGRAIPLIFASALLGFAGDIAIHAPSGDQTPGVGQSPPAEEVDQLLAEGKEIFLERCASCHNERGDKPLKTGVPLNERGLSVEAIAQAVNGRLRDRTENERRAVRLYISSLMQNQDSGKERVPKP